MKLEHAIDEFITHCEYERGLGVKTLKAYRTDLNQLRRAVEIDLKIATVHDLDRNAIRSYLKSISDGYKPRTIRRKIASLKIFLGFLEFEDKITVSPLRKMRLSLKPPKAIPRTIQLREVKKIFKYLYSKRAGSNNQSTFQEITLLRDIAILELLFATGMRVSEVAGLTLERLDLRMGLVHVIGKGKRERIIPICAVEVKDALKQYLAVRNKPFNEINTVFLNRHDKALSEQSVRFMVRKHSRDAGVNTHITPHMFRHTMATELLGNGMDIRYIQDLLGHSSIMTTQIYAHVTDTVRRREIRRRHPRSSMELAQFSCST
jgi:integrase/recombinase XerD